MSKTQVTVAGFLIILVWAIFSSQKANADDIYIELGKTFINSSSSVGGFGYRIEQDTGAWDFHVGLMGEGSTDINESKEGFFQSEIDSGTQTQEFFYSVSRIIYSNWSFMGVEIMPRIGLAKTNHFKLIGSNNYRLGMIFNFDVFEIEFVHLSSANINDINTGVDYLTFRVMF